MVKNPHASVGNVRCRFVPLLERSARVENGNPVFLPRKFHGQRSLAGYSQWGYKESDMTEQLSTHTKEVGNMTRN